MVNRPNPNVGLIETSDTIVGFVGEIIPQREVNRQDLIWQPGGNRIEYINAIARDAVRTGGRMDLQSPIPCGPLRETEVMMEMMSTAGDLFRHLMTEQDKTKHEEMCRVFHLNNQS